MRFRSKCFVFGVFCFFSHRDYSLIDNVSNRNDSVTTFRNVCASKSYSWPRERNVHARLRNKQKLETTYARTNATDKLKSMHTSATKQATRTKREQIHAESCIDPGGLGGGSPPHRPTSPLGFDGFLQIVFDLRQRVSIFAFSATPVLGANHGSWSQTLCVGIVVKENVVDLCLGVGEIGEDEYRAHGSNGTVFMAVHAAREAQNGLYESALGNLVVEFAARGAQEPRAILGHAIGLVHDAVEQVNGH